MLCQQRESAFPVEPALSMALPQAELGGPAQIGGRCKVATGL